jgi:hypothetical protein
MPTFGNGHIFSRKKMIISLTNNRMKKLVGTPRCGVPVRTKRAESKELPAFVAPLDAARTAQRAVPTIICQNHNPKKELS